MGDRPATDRLWTAVLALLILATSLAVATVSVWFVPPYLVLMAWMLLMPGRAGKRPVPPSAPQPQRPVWEAPTPPGREAPPPVPDPQRPRGGWFRRKPPAAPAIPPTRPEPIAPPESLQEEPEAIGPPPPVVPPTPPAKPTRKRRPRTPKAPTPPPEPPSPTEVVWIKVGPNQFVRKEIPIEEGAAPMPAGEDSAAETRSDPGPVDAEAEFPEPLPAGESESQDAARDEESARPGPNPDLEDAGEEYLESDQSENDQAPEAGFDGGAVDDEQADAGATPRERADSEFDSRESWGDESREGPAVAAEPTPAQWDSRGLGQDGTRDEALESMEEDEWDDLAAAGSTREPGGCEEGRLDEDATRYDEYDDDEYDDDDEEGGFDDEPRDRSR